MLTTIKEVASYLKTKHSNTRSKTRIVLVLSGGQDSVTLLAWLYSLPHVAVYPITFTYNQKHEAEVEAAHMAREVLLSEYTDITGSGSSVVHGIKVMDLAGALSQAVTALTDNAPNTTVNDAHPNAPELPASFVPNRNLTMLTTAHSYAQAVGAPCVITGVNAEDYSGYPDCRAQAIHAFEHALNIGSFGANHTGERGISIHAPLMEMKKVAIWQFAQKLGVTALIINHTLTCYNGVQDDYSWGKGCGKCPSCTIRKESYASAFHGGGNNQLELDLKEGE